MAYRFLNYGPQFFDNSGNVLAGGKLRFKESGSDTLQNTFQESAMTTANTNPVVLDANGRAAVNIFLDGTYRVELLDSSDTLIWQRDPVQNPVAAGVSLADVLANGNTSGSKDLEMNNGQKIKTNSIVETTSASGVTIDGVLIKDSGITLGTGGAFNTLDADLSSVSGADDSIASAKAIKTYVDAQVTAQDLDFQGDSGGAQSIDLDSQSLTVEGATGIDTTGTAQKVSIAIDSTVATLSGTQTLTNKTLTSPIVNAGAQLKNGATSAGYVEFFEDSDNGTNKVTLIGPAATADVTLTLPSATDTLVGKATTDTLTNKTLDIDSNTLSNVEVDNLKSGVLDTDLTSVSGSDDTLASAKAIKTYVDAQVTGQDLDFSGDSGGAQSVDLDSQSLTVAGGTGIDTVGSAQTVTLAIDSTVATLAGSQTLTNKTLDIDNNTLSNVEVDNLKSGVLDTNLSSVSGSDDTLASAKAIKTYVDAQVAGGGGAYNDFVQKTSAYTAASKDQIIVNSSSSVTITLPASPGANETVIIHAAGSGPVVVGRNGSNILGLAQDGSLASGSSTQLVYVDSTIGWTQL